MSESVFLNLLFSLYKETGNSLKNPAKCAEPHIELKYHNVLC